MSRLSSRPKNRHAQRDASAVSWLALNFSISFVKNHDALHDRQAQASAARSLRTRLIYAEEPIEHPRQSFRRNADTRIGNFDANGVRIGIRSQHYRSSRRSVRNRVCHQVAHGPAPRATSTKRRASPRLTWTTNWLRANPKALSSMCRGGGFLFVLSMFVSWEAQVVSTT